jgi:hypothetical protein
MAILGAGAKDWGRVLGVVTLEDKVPSAMPFLIGDSKDED